MNAYRLMMAAAAAITLYLICFAVAGAEEVTAAVPASIAEPGSLSLMGIGLLVWVGRLVVDRFSARRHRDSRM